MPSAWPLFELRLRTPRLVLRSPTDDDLFALIEVARAGVHDPDQMPFAVAWTDLAPPDFERSFLRFSWGCRSSWTPEAWELPLAVVLDDRPIGIQELRATGFATLRSVDTGSWLGIAYQGQGIGTEMRAAVLALAFDGLGAEVATSGAIEGNAASRRVSEKLGYEPNGESLVAPRGNPVVEHRYRLRRERWDRDRYPVRIEHLDECLGMFGLDAPAGTGDPG
jgi:RimJ/RimL family protein N-acetyltransferase